MKQPGIKRGPPPFHSAQLLWGPQCPKHIMSWIVATRHWRHVEPVTVQSPLTCGVPTGEDHRIPSLTLHQISFLESEACLWSFHHTWVSSEFINGHCSEHFNKIITAIQFDHMLNQSMHPFSSVTYFARILWPRHRSIQLTGLIKSRAGMTQSSLFLPRIFSIISLASSKNLI